MGEEQPGFTPSLEKYLAALNNRLADTVSPITKEHQSTLSEHFKAMVERL